MFTIRKRAGISDTYNEEKALGEFNSQDKSRKKWQLTYLMLIAVFSHSNFLNKNVWQNKAKEG